MSVQSGSFRGRFALGLAVPVSVLREPLQQLSVEELLESFRVLVHLRVRLCREGGVSDGTHTLYFIDTTTIKIFAYNNLVIE